MWYKVPMNGARAWIPSLARGAVVAFLAGATGCATIPGKSHPDSVPRSWAPRTVRMTVTGYCKCAECCSWHRNWLLRPVYSSGPLRGQRKDVGMTASGRRAGRGTVAADPALPMNAVVYVPGYGYGRVEDRGGDIRGARLDLFFLSHQEAREWGRHTLNVTVWAPPSWHPPPESRQALDGKQTLPSKDWTARRRTPPGRGRPARHPIIRDSRRRFFSGGRRRQAAADLSQQ